MFSERRECKNVECGKSFTAKRKWSWFCCKICKQRWHTLDRARIINEHRAREGTLKTSKLKIERSKMALDEFMRAEEKPEPRMTPVLDEAAKGMTTEELLDIPEILRRA